MDAEPIPRSNNQIVNDVHTQLLDLQRSYRDRIIKELPVSPITAGPPDSYVLESEKIPFSPRIFRELCLRIAPLLSEQVPGEDYVPLLSDLSDASLEQLALALQQVPEQDVIAALGLAVVEVRLHKLTTLDRGALHMLLLAAFVPFYSAFAQQQNVADRWQRGWCPICGQFPVNGYNRPGDGGRVLGCWMCECEWSFTRQGCPVCTSSGTEGMLYLIPENGERNRRIQVCEDCGHYLKISDYAQATEKCDLQRENAATVYLDILAQRQGYRPASRPYNDNQ